MYFKRAICNLNVPYLMDFKRTIFNYFKCTLKLNVPYLMQFKRSTIFSVL